MAGASRADMLGLVGQTLAGSYVIERKIGDGGMGVVYAARHTRLPSRFAVKVLSYDRNDGRDSDEVFRRFEAEAEITAKLRHPHIVQVIDFNRLDARTIYLVMEYLEGEDLGARLRRRGALPLLEVLDIARGMGSALSAAHKQGVVHRDLKPGNLFLAREDHGEEEVEVLKILDFGISKIRRGDQVEATRVGRLLGTPQYMAPEQAQGLNHLVDARADQFAMAVIVYQMISGQRPFDGPQVPVVLLRVMQMDPPPLHQVAAVTEEVAQVVAQAMAKRPEERFASVGDFVRALELAVLGTSAPGRRTGAEELVGEPPTLNEALLEHTPAAVAALPLGVTAASPEQPTRDAPAAPGSRAGPQPVLVAQAGTPAVALASGRPGLDLPQEQTALFTVPAEAALPELRAASDPGAPGRSAPNAGPWAQPPAGPPTTLSGSSGALAVAGPGPRPRLGVSLALGLALLGVGGGALGLRLAFWGAGERQATAAAGAGSAVGAPPAPARAAAATNDPSAAASNDPGAAAATKDPSATAAHPAALAATDRPTAPAAAYPPDATLDRAEARLRAEDLAGARQAFELARQRAPQDYRPPFGLARVAWTQRDFAIASRWLREAMALDPERAELYTLLCQVRYRLGEVRAARAACVRALQLDPQKSDASLLLRSLRPR